MPCTCAHWCMNEGVVCMHSRYSYCIYDNMSEGGLWPSEGKTKRETCYSSKKPNDFSFDLYHPLLAHFGIVVTVQTQVMHGLSISLRCITHSSASAPLISRLTRGIVYCATWSYPWPQYRDSQTPHLRLYSSQTLAGITLCVNNRPTTQWCACPHQKNDCACTPYVDN